jgi:nitrogen fixation protein FixH
MSARAASEFRLNGWHVLAGVLGFFGAVVAVDTVMAVQAYKTFPGEVSATPYEDGLDFNRTLAREQQERSLGWRAKVQTSIGEAGRVQLVLTIVDAQGAPVRGLRLTGQLSRPATEQGRRQAGFVETRAGVYQASAAAAPGAWDLQVSGKDAEGRSFEAQRRLLWR